MNNNNMSTMGTNLSNAFASINVYEIKLAAAIVEVSQRRVSNLEVDIAALRTLISTREIVNHLDEILSNIFTGTGFENNNNDSHISARKNLWYSLKAIVSNMTLNDVIEELSREIFIVFVDDIYALSVEEYKAMTAHYINFILNNAHNIK